MPGVFCGNSERERIISLAPLGPWPSSRYTRKPELLFTAPFAHLWANPPHEADGGLITQSCYRLSPINTDSHYSNRILSLFRTMTKVFAFVYNNMLISLYVRFMRRNKQIRQRNRESSQIPHCGGVVFRPKDGKRTGEENKA